jgi:hypothetical protein
MKSIHLLTALSVLCPALAWSNPVHNVWSTQGLYVSEPGASATPTSANVSFSWTEGTGLAFSNGQATTPAGDRYEFQLVSVTHNTTSTGIRGLWNVSKNGAPLCTSCVGHAYGFGAVGTYFKIYVDGERYHLSGYVSSRYDY